MCPPARPGLAHPLGRACRALPAQYYNFIVILRNIKSAQITVNLQYYNFQYISLNTFRILLCFVVSLTTFNVPPQCLLWCVISKHSTVMCLRLRWSCK